MSNTHGEHSHFLYLCLVSDMKDRGPILPDDRVEGMVHSYMAKHGLTALADAMLPIEIENHAKSCAMESGLPSNYRSPYSHVITET